MNSSTNRLYCQLVKFSKIKPYLNITKNHFLRSNNYVQPLLITRTVIARPKELDDLRQIKKQTKEKEQSKSHKNKNEDYSETDIDYYALFLLSIPMITFGLGTWQVFRRQWKLELLQSLEESLSKEPIDLPENIKDLTKLNYHPIKVRGEFLYDKEFVIGPRSLIKNGNIITEGKGNLISGSSYNKGYNVVTPFKLENRDTVILVNRGWVPHKYRFPEMRKHLQIEGMVEVTGINRIQENRPQFVPKNNPEKSMWFYRDVEGMAEFAKTEPVFLDMTKSDVISELPIPGQTRLNLRNEHLSYIITWYGLSAITGFYWYRIYIRKIPLF